MIGRMDFYGSQGCPKQESDLLIIELPFHC